MVKNIWLVRSATRGELNTSRQELYSVCPHVVLSTGWARGHHGQLLRGLTLHQSAGNENSKLNGWISQHWSCSDRRRIHRRFLGATLEKADHKPSAGFITRTRPSWPRSIDKRGWKGSSTTRTVSVKIFDSLRVHLTDIDTQSRPEGSLVPKSQAHEPPPQLWLTPQPATSRPFCPPLQTGRTLRER